MILKNKKQDYDEKKVLERCVITEYKSKPAQKDGGQAPAESTGQVSFIIEPDALMSLTYNIRRVITIVGVKRLKN